MTSAVRTVERRCATTKLVCPAISASKARCTSISVRVSMLLVASSKISISGRHSIMRAMHKSCFCPAERLPPPGAMTVSYPCGRR